MCQCACRCCISDGCGSSEHYPVYDGELDGGIGDGRKSGENMGAIGLDYG